MKNLLKKWLGIIDIYDRLKKLSEIRDNDNLVLNNYVDSLLEKHIDLKKEHMKLWAKHMALDKEYKKFRSLFMAGANINTSDKYRASSWAVISIKGKQDIVRFYELPESDIRGIAGFLSNFEDTSIDAEPGLKMFFKNNVKR